jgi:hypothetical protein
MEEKYKQFSEINWTENKEWQLYYTNLTPSPPGHRVNHYKKKFYKLKIDYDFDIAYEPPKPTYNANNYQQNRPGATGGLNLVSIYGTTLFGKTMAFIEFVLWQISLVLIFTYHKYALISVIFPLVIRVFRRLGRPNFTFGYAQDLLLDEHLHMLLYMLLLLIDRFNLFMTVPYIMTVILNISDFMRHYGILKNLAEKVVSKRVLLSELRGTSELIIGFLLIVGIFVGTNQFLLPVFYWQFLRFKYIFNIDCKSAFSRLNVIVNNVKSYLPSPLQFPISKIQQLFEYLGRNESKPGEGGAGGANCTIF